MAIFDLAALRGARGGRGGSVVSGWGMDWKVKGGHVGRKCGNVFSTSLTAVGGYGKGGGGLR